MMKKIHLCKATDLYDCGTATFGIAKGNIQSVITLVIMDPEKKVLQRYVIYISDQITLPYLNTETGNRL
jgi:hypothetical protein